MSECTNIKIQGMKYKFYVESKVRPGDHVFVPTDWSSEWALQHMNVESIKIVEDDHVVYELKNIESGEVLFLHDDDFFLTRNEFIKAQKEWRTAWQNIEF